MTSRSPDLDLMSSALHLLHRAGQRADELFTSTMRDNELTPRQFAVLKAVASAENPSQTSRYPAAKTPVGASTFDVSPRSNA